ncbi:MAG TPA: OmpW family outer membrane protein [Steroidobacteraceae bacterium]|nr:OmpW family outer membrane protein [Steroidobacteraceae bacterium]
MRYFNRHLTWAALASLAFGLAAARAADDGSLEIRVRAVRLVPSNNSDAYAPLGIPGDAIHINGKWLPDLDFEYFFAPHWSSELLLTYPQKQTVTVEKSALGGPTVLGTFKHLPPTLTLKYNFLPDHVIQPYVGAGLNITLVSNTNLNVPTVGRLDLDTWSFGPAVQAGVDYKLADHWYLNADLKWAMIRSDVKFQGSTISQARIDPLLLGIGFGYRFGAR